METQNQNHSVQTQSTHQSQSGYKKNAQSTAETGLPPSEPPSSGKSASVSSSMPMDRLKKGFSIAAVVLGMLVGAYWMASPSPEPEPTQVQIEARTQQYQQSLAEVGGVVGVPRVKDSERQEALVLISSDQDRQSLEQKPVPLVWITLWDTEAEDGDVVRVTSEGFSQEVLIRHALARIPIPLPSSGKVAITGSHDGGGGITIGILSGSQRIPVPYLRVRQTIHVPVAATP